MRRGDREQLYLMPPSITEWLPEGHLAWFVADVVEELDLSALYSSYRDDGRGGATYDPAMMLAVLLYAYCTAERSSRRIECKLVEDVAYRVLAANQHPDHATLARFRRRHQEAIAALFAQVLGLCVRAGLVDTGLVAIDGTKMQADASYFANKTKEQLAAEILAEAEATDSAEDERFGERRGDELPAGWDRSAERRSRIKEALRQLEEAPARDHEGRMQERAEKEAQLGRRFGGSMPTEKPARRNSPRKANTTDPDSRIVAGQNRGAMQGYNAQAAVAAGQVVVAAEVTNQTNDQANFVPMATATAAMLEAAGHHSGVGTLVADRGYWTTANATCETGAGDVLIATRRGNWHRKSRPVDDKLEVLAKVNAGELSQRAAGEILGVSYTWVRDMTKRYFADSDRRLTDTNDPDPEQWLPVIARLDRGEISIRQARDDLGISTTRVKTMLAHVRGERPEPSIVRRAMEAKLAEPDKAALFKRRASTVEPVFGQIKANRRFRRFSRRGLPAVNSEWRLVCATNNLLKLWRASLA